MEASTPPSASIPIYTHICPFTSLRTHLTTHLPASIPVLRRLQFYKHSPQARVLATFPSDTSPAETEPWTALYIDRSRAPETQCWIFNSLETETPAERRPYTGFAPGQVVETKVEAVITEDQRTARSQLLALFREVYRLGQTKATKGDSTQEGQSKDILNVGAIHEQTLHLLATLNDDPIYKNAGRDHGVFEWCSEPWLTFLYRPSTNNSSINPPSPQDPTLTLDADLARDLEWSPPCMRSDYALIRSRTAIPRTDATLAVLPSVGLRRREDGKLLAWAFLGVDGAVASLHVEPELRRQGVGKVIFARVLRLLAEPCVEVDGNMVDAYDGVAGERASGELWAYSHASLANKAGLAVAKAAGGMQRWTAYWAGIDLAVC